MTISNGYSVLQEATENRIIITLPQTPSTINNTVMPVSDRKRKLTSDEEALLLMLVEYLFER